MQVLFFLLWLEKLTVVHFLLVDAFAIGSMGMSALLFWRISSSDGRCKSCSVSPSVACIQSVCVQSSQQWRQEPAFQSTLFCLLG